MMKQCQKINFQEPQSNRNATAKYVNLIMTSTVIGIKKHTEDSQKQEQTFKEKWEYRFRTVSDKCHWGFKPGLRAILSFIFISSILTKEH